MNLSLELTIPLIIIVGFASSFIASTIGLGGGITAVPFIMLIIGSKHNLQAKLIAYASIAFLSLIAAGKYIKQKRKPKWKESFWIILGVVPVSIICVIFLGKKFDSDQLKVYFHLMYAFVAILAMLLVNLKNKLSFKKKMPNWSLPLVGMFIGFLSGTFGISGGVVFVPLLVVGLKEKVKEAAVTSLVLKLSVSIANIITALSIGQYQNFNSNNVFWFLPLIILIGAFFGSQLGPIFNKRITNKQINIIFNIVMMIIILWEFINFLIGII